MKKLGIALFIAFIFVAGIYAVFQSEFGKNYVRSTINNGLQDSGLDVQIDRIEGTLPHQIDLKGVRIRGDGVDITVAELKLRPVLWRLLKKEVAFTDVHAKGISVAQGTPFNFDGKFRVNANRAVLDGTIFDWKVNGRYDRRVRLALFTANNPLLNAKGRATLGPDYQLTNANIQIGSDQILGKLPFSAEGRFLANIIVTREEKIYKGERRSELGSRKTEGRICR